MDPFDTGLHRVSRAVGLRLGVIFLVVLAVVGAWVGAYWWAKSTGQLKPIERAVAQYDYVWPHWMGKGAKKASYVETPQDGHPSAAVDPRDEHLRRLQREIDEQRRLLELMRQQKPAPAAPVKATTTPPTIKRPPIYVAAAERKDQGAHVPLWTLAAWTYIPCLLEPIVNSEIPGYFTVKTMRPTWDVTGHHVLIPQGQRVGAKATTAELLLGNERIPTWALSASMPDGSALELGEAPIMDAAGTNGLTGEVNNHVWRLVWTSVVRGGLEGGQQVLQQSLPPDGAGPIAAGIARQGSSATQLRLGRAQDARPTIVVAAGEQCNVLVPKALSLPAMTLASQ